MRGLLNVIQDYTWEDNSDDKVRIYTNVLHLLSAMTQEAYIYHVDKGNTSGGLWLLAFHQDICSIVLSPQPANEDQW